MLRTIHPGDSSHENGLELTGVKMPPAALFRVIITRQIAVTLRAAELRTPWMHDLNPNLFGIGIQLNL
jgi:hypothetical protein